MSSSRCQCCLAQRALQLTAPRGSDQRRRGWTLNHRPHSAEERDTSTGYNWKCLPMPDFY